MRKAWLMTVLAIAAVTAASGAVEAQTYGPGYGYGHGYMMGPGYGGGYGMGPGYMMGPGYDRDDDRGYRRGRGYRGRNMCWRETDRDRGYGYYAPCR